MSLSLINNKKLIDLKSKRHLEQYKMRSRGWQIQNEKSAKMLKRDISNNLFSAIDNYREKREERELVDKIAPDVEKYGETKHWRVNLRRVEQVEPRMHKYDKGHLVENN